MNVGACVSVNTCVTLAIVFSLLHQLFVVGIAIIVAAKSLSSPPTRSRRQYHRRHLPRRTCRRRRRDCQCGIAVLSLIDAIADLVIDIRFIDLWFCRARLVSVMDIIVFMFLIDSNRNVRLGFNCNVARHRLR